MREIKEIREDITKREESWGSSPDEPYIDELYDELYIAITKDISFDRLEEICNAERDGRCVIQPLPPVPLLIFPDKNDSDAYCSTCGHDLSGCFPRQHSEEIKVIQCPNCGQFIDDTHAITISEYSEKLYQNRKKSFLERKAVQRNELI